MRIQFKCFGPIRRALGTKLLDIEAEEGSTVGDIVDKVVEMGGEEVRDLVKPQGRISGNLIIMLNQKDVTTIGGVTTIVKEGDTVSLLPHVQGG
ncbi:MAG: MoaD/ThiS family protein [Candidatus Thorarchaeota archaeon]|nr:MAG: MoaD/ThiS family protein [Candidatus Thorarchaeota archaeon]